MNAPQNEFERLLEDAVRFHGHLCGGQVIGTRMAMVGLRELGITDPRGTERKDFLVILETDRCAADAIIAVTGLTPGKRTVKILDYGKMAATFVHLPSGRAVRVHARSESKRKAQALVDPQDVGAPREKDAYLDVLVSLSEEDLLSVQKVRVQLEPWDLPGPPSGSVTCQACGESVLDRREVYIDGVPHCQPCAAGQSRYPITIL